MQSPVLEIAAWRTIGPIRALEIDERSLTQKTATWTLKFKLYTHYIRLSFGTKKEWLTRRRTCGSSAEGLPVSD